MCKVSFKSPSKSKMKGYILIHLAWVTFLTIFYKLKYFYHIIQHFMPNKVSDRRCMHTWPLRFNIILVFYNPSVWYQNLSHGRNSCLRILLNMYFLYIVWLLTTSNTLSIKLSVFNTVPSSSSVPRNVYKLNWRTPEKYWTNISVSYVKLLAL